MTQSAPKHSLPGHNTQARLLETAERLFANNGIDGVSLNRIRTEAKARNSSALQYYFGSKKVLIESTLAYRMSAINVRRHQMLEALSDQDREQKIRLVVHALIIPFAEKISSAAGETCYVRFVAQVYSHPDLSIASLFHNRHASGLRKAIQLLNELLSQLPQRIREQRIQLLQSLSVHALADLERNITSGKGPESPSELHGFVAGLIQVAVAGLLAPVEQEFTPNLALNTPDQEASS